MIGERYNVSTLLDRNLEAGRGDRVAIRCGDEDVTYAQLLDRVSRFGRALRDLGVEREQRVLMVCDDTPVFPTAFLGAIRAGAVPVPVSPLARTDDYRYFLTDSYAKVAVVDAALLPSVREALADTRVQAVVANGEPEVLPGSHRFDDLIDGQDAELDPVDTHRDDMAFWLYSSGSTGRPKGVVHLQHDIPATCRTYAENVLQITADDVTFSTTKLFHAYGLGNNLTFPYWVGATTVLQAGRPAPDHNFATIARHRPTLFFSVPTLYNAMLNEPGGGEQDLSSIRLCVSAAEALPPEVWRRWKKAYNLVILDGIGSTEMLHIFCSNSPGDVVPGSSGKPVPGYELDLRDFDGHPVRQGETGNLHVKGDSAFAFYWHQSAKTRGTVLGEWVYAGDRYRVDDDGHWWYEGRADDMMKVGGLWVSPIEIENTLVEHPGVSEAAVVAISVDGLARIKASVTCRPGVAASEQLGGELQEWCKQRLRRYQYPHVVEFVDELPKTATGKIQRYKLRDKG